MQRGLPPTEWVIARALCRFRRFDLRAIPKAQQAQGLGLQISQWSPYPRTGRAIVMKDGLAQVWIWDAELVEAAQRASGVDPRRIAPVPGPLLPPARAEGVRLLHTPEGYEGQVWRQGQLVSSAWWPDIPDEAAWRNFLRDASLPPGAQPPRPPQAEAVTWLPRPWARPVSLVSATNVPRLEAVVVAFAAFMLITATFWFGAQAYQLSAARASLGQALQQSERAAGQILAVRGEALDRLARVEAFHKLDPYPDALTLMARVGQLIPAGTATLREWEYDNGRLKFVLNLQNPVLTSDLVKSLQAVTAFDQVQAHSSPNPAVLPLSLVLVPHAPLDLAVKQDGAARADRPAGTEPTREAASKNART